MTTTKCFEASGEPDGCQPSLRPQPGQGGNGDRGRLIGSQRPKRRTCSLPRTVLTRSPSRLVGPLISGCPHLTSEPLHEGRRTAVVHADEDRDDARDDVGAGRWLATVQQADSHSRSAGSPIVDPRPQCYRPASTYELFLWATAQPRTKRCGFANVQLSPSPVIARTSGSASEKQTEPYAARNGLTVERPPQVRTPRRTLLRRELGCRHGPYLSPTRIAFRIRLRDRIGPRGRLASGPDRRGGGAQAAGEALTHRRGRSRGSPMRRDRATAALSQPSPVVLCRSR
jgi:hypothetical protein